MEFLKEHKTVILIGFCILWLAMSLLTFLLYKIDKVKAEKHKWRIKEATLLIFPWLFGSVGGILGMYVLRHKTRHWYFVLNNFLAILVYLAVFIFLLIL